MHDEKVVNLVRNPEDRCDQTRVGSGCRGNVK